MGVTSKYARYHGNNQEANVNNVARFGEPAHSLYTSAKIFTLHKQIDITDDQEQLVYRSRSKMISIKDKTEIIDAAGKTVANIERKVFTIHEKHIITMADGDTFTLSTELLHLVKDVINIPDLGWQIRGNLFQVNFEIYDSDGSVLAVIGRKMISIHEKFCIDIYKPEKEGEIIAVLVALEHMIQDREQRQSSSSSYSSSSN